MKNFVLQEIPFLKTSWRFPGMLIQNKNEWKNSCHHKIELHGSTLFELVSGEKRHLLFLERFPGDLLEKKSDLLWRK